MIDHKQIKDLWKCIIPPGELGSAKVSPFTVTRSGSMFASLRGDHVQEGDYTRLSINGQLVMSDTSDERRDHYQFFREAKGNVLIHGLGLGCCLNVIRNMPGVDHITVIEINPDIICLVGQNFPEIEIIQADALTWKSPKNTTYNAVWHDIWPDKCIDNLASMHKLHRRYGHKSEWQGSWSREQLEIYKRSDQRHSRR